MQTVIGPIINQTTMMPFHGERFLVVSGRKSIQDASRSFEHAARANHLECGSGNSNSTSSAVTFSSTKRNLTEDSHIEDRPRASGSFDLDIPVDTSSLLPSNCATTASLDNADARSIDITQRVVTSVEIDLPSDYFPNELPDTTDTQQRVDESEHTVVYQEEDSSQFTCFSTKVKRSSSDSLNTSGLDCNFLCF